VNSEHLGLENQRALFNDFAATSHLVTARHYHETLKLAATNPRLKPVEDFSPEQAAAGKAES
jgi:hypothetical protein